MRQLAAFVLCIAIAIPAWATSSPLDPTFGFNGRVSTNIASDLSMQRLHGAVLQPDGKLVVAGTVIGALPIGFGVKRLNADGTPDAQFIENFQMTAKFGFDRYTDAFAVALQADGKIVAAGYYGFGPDNVVAVARFLVQLDLRGLLRRRRSRGLVRTLRRLRLSNRMLTHC